MQRQAAAAVRRARHRTAHAAHATPQAPPTSKQRPHPHPHRRRRTAGAHIHPMGKHRRRPPPRNTGAAPPTCADRSWQHAAAELMFTPLTEEPLLVAMHAGHWLAKAASLKLKYLRGEPFIAYPRQAGVTISQWTLALCAKRGFDPEVVQEAQQASTLIGLTATGLAIALVPATLQSIVLSGWRNAARKARLRRADGNPHRANGFGMVYVCR